MPIGIIGSLIVCTVIYVVVAAVFTGMVPFPVLQHLNSSQQAEPLTMAMKYVRMPNYMVGIVALGSVIAHTAVLLVFQLGQPRILFAMARDGFLPPSFAKVHPKFRTPHVATILTGVIVGLAAAVANIDEMVDLTNIGTLFAFILVCLGIMVLRFKDPGRERPFRVPLGPVFLPGLGLIACVYLIFFLPPSSWWRFFGWLLAGLVVYFLYGYRHSRLRNGPPSGTFNPAADLPPRELK
jgi:APA family basic amino acid/polyamine antiporter